MKKYFIITFILLLNIIPRFGYCEKNVSKQQQKRVVAMVNQLNNKAFDAYTNLELDQSVQLLQQALQLCEQNRITGETLARTHLNLGMIYILAFNDLVRGRQQFEEASEISTDIEPNPLYTTPIISQLWSDISSQNRHANQNQSSEGSKSVKIIHTPVTEQLPDYPIPIYAEITGTTIKGKKLLLSYKTENSSSYTDIELEPYERGFKAKIPCVNAIENTNIEYFITLYDEDLNILSNFGTENNPYVISIHSPLSGSAPQLPGLEAEQICSADELENRSRSIVNKRYFYFEFNLGTGFGIPFGTATRLDPCVENSQPQDIKVSPSATWTPLHLGTEIGAYINPNFGLGVWGRFQMPVLGAPFDWAAGIKGRWYFIANDPLRFWMFFGAGYGILHHKLNIKEDPAYPFQCEEAKTFYKYAGGLNGEDTAGLWFTVGAGMFYNPIKYVGFGPTISFTTIIPEAAIQFDLSLTVQVSY